MGIHSKILVHWTEPTEKKVKCCSSKAHAFVEWLRDDLANGLYVERKTEDSIRYWKIENLLRICFTEIKLSQARKHACRYGELGIGFARDFVMNRGGRPVIYIPFRPPTEGRLLEESMERLNANLGGTPQYSDVKWVLAHVKRMSDPKDERCEGEDCYYEEMEWRLVHGDDTAQQCFEQQEEGSEVYRLRFQPSDVKVIVFPDADTKQLALEDDYIGKYFSEHAPIMVTLEECDSF